MHAAHIIAHANGGPSGTDAAYAWNFVPLCGPCNLDMKTQHLIDWFYDACSKPGRASGSLVFAEVIDRLHRAAQEDYGVNGFNYELATESIERLYLTGYDKCAGHATVGREKKGPFEPWNTLKEDGGLDAGYTTDTSDLLALYSKGILRGEYANVSSRDKCVEQLEDCAALIQTIARTRKRKIWEKAERNVDTLKKDLEKLVTDKPRRAGSA